MKKILLGLIFLVFASTASFAGNAKTAIEAGAVAFVDAFNSGDGKNLAALYTEDATVLPPGGATVVGREAIAKFWQGAIDSGLKAEKIDPVEVHEMGDLTGEVGNFILIAPGESGETKVHGKYIVIWKQVDGTWQLHRDIYNMN